MVNHCYNPTCHRELRYLRDGRVVRIVRGDGENARLEHYWLCGNCSESYEFFFTSDESIGLRLRASGDTPSRVFIADKVVGWPMSSQE